MSKKIDFRIVIVIIVALFVAEHIIFDRDDPVEDVSIVTDEVVGGVEKKVDSVIRDTIYIDRFVKGKKLPQKKQIVVDSLYKAEYEKALKDNDSLKAKNLFLESIALDTYEGTLVDDDDIKIDGKFLTRGKLLEYKIDYKIKSDTITYTPKTISRMPKLSLVYGMSLAIPTNPTKDLNMSLRAEIGLMNKKGNMYLIGIDSDQRISVGYRGTLRLLK